MEKWSGYHRRSLVETKMHCIKLLGDKLTARSFSSQVNEIHARIAVLNKFTELGRPHTQVVTEFCSNEQSVIFLNLCATKPFPNKRNNIREDV